MLRACNAPRMPPNRPLPEDDIQLVERWILNGAKYPGFHIGDAGTADAPRDAAPSDRHPVRAAGRRQAADSKTDVARDVGRGG